MKKKVLFLLILIWAFISRFWQIDKIPPLIYPTNLSGRFISAVLNIGSAIVLYFYAKMIFKKTKISLLATLIFLLLPWTIEQGRIVSPVSNSVFVLLTFLILINKLNKLHFKILFFVLCLIFFVFFYPQFWLFHTNELFLPAKDFINNIFTLTSFDFLFFKNITFWWGGVREAGILYLAFLPFLLIGAYQVVSSGKYKILVIMSLILVISAASPFFPESREFFLVTPFISIIIASGLNKLYRRGNRVWQFICLVILILVIYDMAQFWHYYSIHYPQQVSANLSKIHEPF